MPVTRGTPARTSKWLESEKDINNPKIPLGFVMDQVTLVYDGREVVRLSLYWCVDEA